MQSNIRHFDTAHSSPLMKAQTMDWKVIAVESSQLWILFFCKHYQP
jgi:hypothetical protein